MRGTALLCGAGGSCSRRQRGDAGTEELRVALQQYRTFWDRLEISPVRLERPVSDRQLAGRGLGGGSYISVPRGGATREELFHVRSEEHTSELQSLRHL